MYNWLMYESTDIAMRPVTIFTTVDETVRAIADICKKFGAEAWLFGSQARGTARKGSDIDIAVRSSQFDDVEEALEEIDTVFIIDVVDLSQPHVKGVDDARIRIA